jgi:hypothetical protein
MSDRQTGHLESSTKEAASHTDTTTHLQRDAGVFHQCKDGSIVTRPRDCREGSSILPPIQIDGEEKLAGKTIRRGQDGTTCDGGKVLMG